MVDPVPGPVDNFHSRIRGVPNDIKSELNQLLSESSDLVQDTDDVITTTINNAFRKPIDSENGATGTLIEEDGVLYVQKCLHGEYYYESCGGSDHCTEK